MKIALLLTLLPSLSVAACPKGQKAVGDDSERGYKCVPRDPSEKRPTLKRAQLGAVGNDVKPAPAENAAAEAAPKKSDCPRGWIKKGEGCAPPPKKD